MLEMLEEIVQPDILVGRVAVAVRIPAACPHGGNPELRDEFVHWSGGRHQRWDPRLASIDLGDRLLDDPGQRGVVRRTRRGLSAQLPYLDIRESVLGEM